MEIWKFLLKKNSNLSKLKLPIAVFSGVASLLLIMHHHPMLLSIFKGIRLSDSILIFTAISSCVIYGLLTFVICSHGSIIGLLIVIQPIILFTFNIDIIQEVINGFKQLSVFETS